MSVEAVYEFTTDLAKNDPELLESLLEADAEEVLKVAQERGFDASLEDIQQAGSVLNTVLQQQAQVGEDGEIDEKALEDVAGGIAPLAALGAVAAVVSITSGTFTIANGITGGGLGSAMKDGLVTAGNAVGNFFKSW